MVTFTQIVSYQDLNSKVQPTQIFWVPQTHSRQLFLILRYCQHKYFGYHKPILANFFELALLACLYSVFVFKKTISLISGSSNWQITLKSTTLVYSYSWRYYYWKIKMMVLNNAYKNGFTYIWIFSFVYKAWQEVHLW